MRLLPGKKWALVAVFLILSMVLLTAVGCAGSKKAEEANPPAENEAAAGSGQTADTISEKQLANPDINIGILVPYTGELGAYGNYWFGGGKVAADEINAAGGILGKKIKIFTEDSETSVEQGIRAAQKLVKANNVIAIHGVESSVSIATHPFCKESQVVIANPAGGSTRLDKMGPDYMFRTCPSDNFEGVAVARMLQDAGFKSVGIMYENDESRVSSANALKAQFEKLGGKVTAVAYAPRQNTYLSELKQVFADKPDAFFLAGGQESGAIIIKEWYQRGYGSQMIVTADLTVPEFFTFVNPKAVEGCWGELPMADTSLPEYQRFAKIYEKFSGAPPTGSYESNAYDAMIILGLAIQIAGEATGKGISEHYMETQDPNGVKVSSFEDGVAELKKGNKINYEGASGPCDFNQYGNVVGSYVQLVAKNGKWEQNKFYPATIFADYLKENQ